MSLFPRPHFTIANEVDARSVLNRRKERENPRVIERVLYVQEAVTNHVIATPKGHERAAEFHHAGHLVTSRTLAGYPGKRADASSLNRATYTRLYVLEAGKSFTR